MTTEHNAGAPRKPFRAPEIRVEFTTASGPVRLVLKGRKAALVLALQAAGPQGVGHWCYAGGGLRDAIYSLRRAGFPVAGEGAMARRVYRLTGPVVITRKESEAGR